MFSHVPNKGEQMMKCNGAMRILVFIEDQDVRASGKISKAAAHSIHPALVLDSNLSQLHPWEDNHNQDPGFPIHWSA